MGLFDFFRLKKSGADSAAPNLEAKVNKIMERGGTRPQYYYFAHYALREAAYELGAACAGVLMSPRKDDLVVELWKNVTEAVRQKEPKAPLDPPPELEVLPLVAGKLPCVVVKFPEPRGMTECHFVGIVMHFDPSTGESPTQETKVEYFTLERGEDGLGNPRTVLCSWSKEGAHSNYGDGPPPEPDAFANAIGQKLAGRGFPTACGFTPGER